MILPGIPIHCLSLLLIVGVASWLNVTEAATEYNRYLAHIFRKYGNGGTMTFEGLEHLMFSLGLGQIEFDPTHTIDEHRPNGMVTSNPAADSEDSVVRSYFQQQAIQLLANDENDVQLKTAKDVATQHKAAQRHADINGADVAPDDDKEIFIQEKGVILEFKEMHDPKHRHPREHDGTFENPPLSSTVCLSPKALLRLVVDHDDLHKRKLYRTFNTKAEHNPNLHDFEAEYNEFINNVKLTPIAFMKLCPVLLSQIDQQVCMQPAPMHMDDTKEMLWNAWLYASFSILVLSACGLLGVLLVPLMKSAVYQEILQFLVAVAVGTLSGDALMHLLPHALVSEHVEPAELQDDHPHGHDNRPVWICVCAFTTVIFMYMLEHLLPLLRNADKNGGHGHSHGNSVKAHKRGSSETKPAESTAAVVPSTAANNDATQCGEAHEVNTMLDELKKDPKSPSPPLTPVAFMVIIGDGLHNLTDGLAIGAAFATDPVTGMATAFAVLCHELPHELGDFALLLQTGMPLQRAVCMNIVSSVLSFVGMAIGLLIAGLRSSMTQWIYAATAGSFLYIALTDLMPAMNDGTKSGKGAVKDTLIQVSGIIVGGVIMLLIAVNEEALEALFK